MNAPLVAQVGRYRVQSQETRTLRGNVRYAYCIEEPGVWPYVSDYQYRTAEAALAAGERDARESLALDRTSR